MALTIATGFVVDDAIVVIENITRYLEAGHDAAARRRCAGAQEIGFTVLSISVSLVAVFIPILLMGGIVGRLFREFAVTLSVAIVVSLVVSLTTTPMMCAQLLQAASASERHGRLYRASERVFDWMLGRLRAHARAGCCAIQPLTLLVTLATIGADRLSVHRRAQGLLPAAGHRAADRASIQADQDISFQAMQRAAARSSSTIVEQDPAVDNVIGVHRRRRRDATPAACSSRSSRSSERKVDADQVIARLRAEARARSRRDAVPAGGAGPARRRPRQQRAVSVHAAGRQPRRPERLGAAAARSSCARCRELADVNSDQQNQRPAGHR